MNYTQAATLFESARNKEKGKPLENNTRLFDRGSHFAVRLHNTDVVDILPNGTYQLRSGGWRTVTTKDRINKYAPVRLYSERSVWYLSGNGKRYAFEEDILIDKNGCPIGDVRDLDAILARQKKVEKLIRTYINGYAKDALTNGIKDPSGRDCWGCFMTADDRDSQKPYGTDMGLSHFFSHFEENYFVPSLVFNAIRSRGYNDPPLIWHVIQRDLTEGRTTMLKDVLRSYFRKLKPLLVEAYIEEEVEA